ncbi:high affinity methionine permease [Pterulicium gracile]|uniref:High affinity methionine permease n=1 Tax=Pterulicium gracile TaxID=1884261 RepID=A0A5C3QPX2_9AGAR|nr:high affinity methionine permease [Pterula gracilis]
MGSSLHDAESVQKYDGPYTDRKQGELVAVTNASDDEHFDDVPQEKRQLGLVSVIFLIFNRIIGTGIFATPSSILRSAGSVGMAFILWLIGALIAAAGMAVYTEFGTGLPRNGGEKNYLEYIYRHPKFLVTCAFGAYASLLGWAAGNSLVFGEYILIAAGKTPTQWNTRAVALACITWALLIHGTALKWGLRIQNVLGVFKVAILILIAFSGFAALAGRVKIDPKPDNFTNSFEGTGSINANAFVTGLYNVIWSYIGYSNANYALTEIKNPVPTLKKAGPLAIIGITILYMLVNVAYFAAVPKEDILNSGRTVAALFFRNMFGPSAERALSVFVALSALGNIMSVMFSQGRIVQELGREGVLPFSSFFASNKPFNAPFAGLFLHWAVSVIIMLAPPPGDAFDLVLNMVSYPLAIINALISGGLLLLYTPVLRHWNWAPPFRATIPVVLFFFLSNVFLVIAPLVPPPPGSSVYKSLPYWLHVVISVGVFALGGVYWVVWAKVLPSVGKYRLERAWVKQSDGVSRAVFTKTKTQ